MPTKTETDPALVSATAQVVAAYLGRNDLTPREIPVLIAMVYASILGLGTAGVTVTGQEPAVPINKSITPEYIICLEDGKRFKMLKRYLRTRYEMSPDQYRQKWGLPADYPMVAPAYARWRADFAKQIGLGKPGVAKSKRRKR